MTRRERIIQAIRHRETDFVPYQVDLTRQAHERLVEYTGDPGYIDRIGNHIIGTGYANKVEVEPGSGYWRDLFGIIWNKNGADKDIGVVDNLVLPEPTLDNFTFPEIDNELMKHNCEMALESAGDKFRVFSIGFSMFERAWTLRGMENVLMDMVAEPDFMDALLDAIRDWNLKVLDKALEYPFDGFMFGDDWGQQKGLIMGPTYWRRFIKPRVARMYDKAKQNGKFVLQHSCGDINELFPDLIEIGLDVYQTFQPEIYDIKAVKREYGSDLTFWGGISTQRVLPWVTPDEVRKVTREMIEVMGVGGGYIAGPTHAVPGDVPPENIVAMVEEFGEQ